GFFADVRMELSGQLAVGPLDLVCRGGALDAERGVVVLEFHPTFPATERGLAGNGRGGNRVCDRSEASSINRMLRALQHLCRAPRVSLAAQRLLVKGQVACRRRVEA